MAFPHGLRLLFIINSETQAGTTPKCYKAASQLCSGPHGHFCATARVNSSSENSERKRECVVSLQLHRSDEIKWRDKAHLSSRQMAHHLPAHQRTEGARRRERTLKQERPSTGMQGDCYSSAVFLHCTAGPICLPSCQDNALKVTETTPLSNGEGWQGHCYRFL